MLHAALLDPHTYEEVEADRHATSEAFVVVLLASVAAGIGAIENHGPEGILLSTVVGVVGWYVWAFVTYFIGTRFFPTHHTQSDHGELLRTIGFSSSPGLLRIFALVSPIAGIVFLVCTLWMLVSMVVAVRQALDYDSTWRAVAVCAVGFPIYALILATSLVVMGPWPI